VNKHTLQTVNTPTEKWTAIYGGAPGVIGGLGVHSCLYSESNPQPLGYQSDSPTVRSCQILCGGDIEATLVFIA